MKPLKRSRNTSSNQKNSRCDGGGTSSRNGEARARGRALVSLECCSVSPLLHHSKVKHSSLRCLNRKLNLSRVREQFAGQKMPRRTPRRIGFQPVQAFVAQATDAVLTRNPLPFAKPLKWNRLEAYSTKVLSFTVNGSFHPANSSHTRLRWRFVHTRRAEVQK